MFAKEASRNPQQECKGREFAWTDADFDRVQAMIYKSSGD